MARMRYLPILSCSRQQSVSGKSSGLYMATTSSAAASVHCPHPVLVPNISVFVLQEVSFVRLTWYWAWYADAIYVKDHVTWPDYTISTINRSIQIINHLICVSPD